ncbi:MAG: formyltetrahydrofolate deformylase [Sulfuricurvum sp. PC08-66]|nr:MAG: formyltetrahydrofolate deformylase [Sulfuricurvum sp. PC08-66]
MQLHHVLIDTFDAKGLVYKISELFFRHNLNIQSNSEYVDREHNKFFMRSEIAGEINPKLLHEELQLLLGEKANIRIFSPLKKRIVLLVTKESHCLGDILIRYEAGELNAQILGVISNYETLKPLVDKFDIPFIHIGHENLSREAHESAIISAIQKMGEVDYIVLAKYMRILTSVFVETFPEKILNIHHSFLPAFVGANPYKQAFERGVKIIGATAHFVNNHLDEGPIITQNIINVDHSYSWKEMQHSGRDVEKIVLSSALKLVIENRVFVHANKTVIL